jgi:hypothetical protein
MVKQSVPRKETQASRHLDAVDELARGCRIAGLDESLSRRA